MEREESVDQSVKSGVTRNSNISQDIETERMVDRSGHPDERNSSKAQIRTI